MDDSSGKFDLDNEEYDASSDPERELMMKMHEQDVQEFLEEYDESDDSLDELEYKQKYSKQRLTGIGGWLVLLIVILSINIFVGALMTVLSITLPSLKTPSLGFILNLVTTLLSVFLLVILAKKLWFFPRMYQIFIGVLGIGRIFLMIVGGADALVILSVILLGLWIIYFHYSKRVKYTFIYRWNGAIYEKPAAKSIEG